MLDIFNINSPIMMEIAIFIMRSMRMGLVFLLTFANESAILRTRMLDLLDINQYVRINACLRLYFRWLSLNNLLNNLNLF